MRLRTIFIAVFFYSAFFSTGVFSSPCKKAVEMNDSSIVDFVRKEKPEGVSIWPENSKEFFAFLQHSPLSYQEAKKLIQSENINTKQAYRLFQNTYPMLPAAPDVVYKGQGWQSWDIFLGNEKAPFSEQETADQESFILGVTRLGG